MAQTHPPCHESSSGPWKIRRIQREARGNACNSMHDGLTHAVAQTQDPAQPRAAPPHPSSTYYAVGSHSTIFTDCQKLKRQQRLKQLGLILFGLILSLAAWPASADSRGSLPGRLHGSAVPASSPGAAKHARATRSFEMDVRGPSMCRRGESAEESSSDREANDVDEWRVTFPMSQCAFAMRSLGLTHAVRHQDIRVQFNRAMAQLQVCLRGCWHLCHLCWQRTQKLTLEPSMRVLLTCMGAEQRSSALCQGSSQRAQLLAHVSSCMVDWLFRFALADRPRNLHACARGIRQPGLTARLSPRWRIAYGSTLFA